MGTGDGKFRIRHAFFTYKDWTFGQTWSLMSNMETRTESVDYTQFMGTSYTQYTSSALRLEDKWQE